MNFHFSGSYCLCKCNEVSVTARLEFLELSLGVKLIGRHADLACVYKIQDLALEKWRFLLPK